MDLKKVTIICVTLLAVMVLFLCICVGAQTQKCKNTVYRFEEACNELNVEEMLNCINPTTAEGLKVVWSVGDFFGVNDFLFNTMKEKVGDIAEGLGMNLTEVSKILVASLDFDLRQVKVKASNAELESAVMFNINSIKLEFEIKIDMIKVNGEWYINSIRFTDE